MYYTYFINSLKSVSESISKEAIRELENYIVNCKRIFFIGNGGSHSICSHMSTDLFKRLNKEAYSLTSHELLTCLSNDYGFENAYVEWLKRYEVNFTDLVIIISSSGKSKNILNVIQYLTNFQTFQSNVVFIHGFEKLLTIDSMPTILDIYIDSNNYGVVELSSEIILHSIIEHLVENNKFKI